MRHTGIYLRLTLHGVADKFPHEKVLGPFPTLTDAETTCARVREQHPHAIATVESDPVLPDNADVIAVDQTFLTNPVAYDALRGAIEQHKAGRLCGDPDRFINDPPGASAYLHYGRHHTA